MKFAIITPAFNRPKLLRRCIDSVLAQTYSDWTLVVIDDGSRANTLGEITECLADPRIQYYKLDENMGANYARNLALDKLAGTKVDYITFLDDDDYLTVDCLTAASEVIASNPDYNWFVSRCVLQGGLKTRIRRFGRLDYVKDYFFGRAISGDAFMVIAASCIEAIRFPDTVKNGNEELFFYYLASRESMFAYDHDSKIIEYLPDGLTKNLKWSRSKKA